MTESSSPSDLIALLEPLVDTPDQVWRWVATPGYLVAETPWQVLKLELESWDALFARLLNQEFQAPDGWVMDWEPGACVLSRVAFVGPSIDGLLLEGYLSKWCVAYLEAQLERGLSIAFRGGGRASRWVARAVGALFPMGYETRGRGLPLDPRLLVWEGRSLPPSSNVIVVSAQEFNETDSEGVPCIVDQVGRKVPRAISTLVEVRRDGRVLRVQERARRGWKTLFQNHFIEDKEALVPTGVPSDGEFWEAHGRASWWHGIASTVSVPPQQERMKNPIEEQSVPQEFLEPAEVTVPIEAPLPTVEPLPAAIEIEHESIDLNRADIDEGWEVGGASAEDAPLMTGDDAVLEASLGLGPPPAPSGTKVQRDPALTALLSAIRKDIDG